MLLSRFRHEETVYESLDFRLPSPRVNGDGEVNDASKVEKIQDQDLGSTGEAAVNVCKSAPYPAG